LLRGVVEEVPRCARAMAAGGPARQAATRFLG